MPRARVFGVLTTVASLLVVMPARSVAQAVPERFGADASTLVFATDSAPRAAPGSRGPSYPRAMKEQGVEAAVPVAFIVDTAGRVEPRSVSFLSPVAPQGFRTSICEFLLRARFEPLRQDGGARRALVLEPFLFGLEGGRFYHARPDMGPQREAARRLGLDSTLALLDRQPHCRK
jgi:hypothetical protein